LFGRQFQAFSDLLKFRLKWRDVSVLSPESLSPVRIAQVFEHVTLEHQTIFGASQLPWPRGYNFLHCGGFRYLLDLLGKCAQHHTLRPTVVQLFLWDRES